MNVLKKVREFLGTGESLYSFGIESAAPKTQQEKQLLSSGALKNSGSLCLPKVIAGEIARLVTIEFDSGISGSKRAEYLDGQYKRFLPKIREICETACGLGGVILKPYVKGSNIEIGVVTPDMFVPTEISPSGDVTGGVFVERIFRDSKVYSRLESHSFSGDEYVISNKCYVADRIGNVGREIPLSLINEWKNIKPSVRISGLTKPLFAYFKIPSNSAELPLGESVFARSIHLIKDAEEQYKRLLWEFESGERALYIDDAAIRKDAKGNREIPDKRLYRLVNQEDLFSDWTPEIRDASIINGLDEILRRIEFNSGLAYGTLSKVSDSDKTAEEVRASKQRSYARVLEIQNALRFALGELIIAMDALCDLYLLSEKGEYNVYFDFDDSIIADRNREFDERLALFEAGIISKEELRKWYFCGKKGR